MTAPALGPSWLPGRPGAVQSRRIDSCRVAAAMGDLFSARVPGEPRRRHFALTQVADGDAPLVVRGARFWWLDERVLVPGGRVEWRSAVAFARDGQSAEAAFRAWTDTEGQR